MQKTVYRINVEHKDLIQKSSYREQINFLIEKHNDKIRNGDLPEDIQDASLLRTPTELTAYPELVFYRYTKYSKPVWYGFLPVVPEDEYASNPSFVCFFPFKENLFVITGGSGFDIIRSYVDYNFGIDVAVRLINEKSNIIHEIQEQDLIGNALSRTTQFKQNQTFFDVERFAKIYSKIVAEIDKKTLREKLGITIDFKENFTGSNFESKTGFKLKKKVSFQDVYNLIGNINVLLNQKPSIELNKVLRVREPEKKKELDNILLDNIDEYINGIKPNFEFEFIHAKEKQKFINANTYLFKQGKIELSFESLDDLNNKLLIELASIENRRNDFRKYIFDGQLIGINESGKNTKGKLISHIQTEIVDSTNKHYFRVNATWWHIKDTFISDVNRKASEIIKEIKSKKNYLNEVWHSNESEGMYNQKFINKKNYIVLDKKLPENIELADILYFDDETIYLIHVKKGFDRNIRVLSSQINIAAMRLAHSIRDDKEYIVKLYKKLETSIKNQYSKDEFLNLFEKKIVFVMAFSSNTYNLENHIKEIKSSIAKYSLIDLFYTCSANNFELEIYLLKTDKTN